MLGVFPFFRQIETSTVMTQVNGAHKDAALWSSHDKMLVQPLKDGDTEVRRGESYLNRLVYS